MKKITLSVLIFIGICAPVLLKGQCDSTTLGLNVSSVNATSGCNGSAMANAYGGFVPYAFNWSPGGNNTQNPTGLCPGSYTVTISDSHGCTRTAVAMIDTSGSAPCSLTVNTSIANATLGCNGAAVAIPMGGTPGYSFHWNKGGDSTQNISGLCPGSYMVTVTDSKGCSAMGMAMIGSNPCATFSANVMPVNTTSGCNGSITASATGGTPGYTYRWSNSDTTATISGLCTSSSYTVTVMDSKGCSIPVMATIDSSGPAPCTLILTTTATKATSGCNGMATAVPSGGTAPYLFHWSNLDTTAHITGLCAAIYTVTVLDSKGCSAVSITDTLSAKPCKSFSVNISTTPATSGCNGSAIVSVIGGTPGYRGHWSNGDTVPNISGLCPGFYSVSVSDSKGCTATAAAVLDSSTSSNPCVSFSANIMTINATAGCNGSANVNAMNGTPPYQYHWNNMDSMSAVSGLCPGSYMVTVMDSKGCSAMNTAMIDSAGSNPCVSFSANIMTINATAGCNGSASVSVKGGNPAYSYQWSNMDSTSSIAGLCIGTYSITVIDSKGCSAMGIAVIDTVGGNPCSSPPVISITSTNVTCAGKANGKLIAEVSGGTAPYGYSWSNYPGIPSDTLSGLTAGTYTVTVHDSKGCSATAAVTITHPANLLVTVAETSANCGQANGTVAAIGSGGTPGYSYIWSPGGAVTSTIANLSAGTYTVELSDNHGCTSTASGTVSSSSGSTAVVSSSMDVNCFGGTTGSATVSVTGGTSPFIYSWSNGASSTTASNLSAGAYTVTVSDMNGCTSSATIIITQPAALISSGTSTTAVCGQSNGSVSVNVTGGTPGYSYSWSSGVSTQTSTSLASGTYTVTLTDSKGCTASTSQTISNTGGAAIAVAFMAPACTGGSNGSATVSGSGGTFPYTYEWNTGNNTGTTSGLTAGSYSVSLTDANGCLSTSTVIVTQPAVISIQTTTTSDISSGCVGTISAGSTGGTMPYKFSWSNGSFNSDLSKMCAGTYTLTVTDANNCIQTAITTVNDSTGINVCAGFSVTVSGTTAQITSCTGNASASVSGGTAPYSYSWSNFYNTASISNLCPNNYVVQVTDANGCNSSSGITIVANTTAVTFPLNVFLNTQDASSASNCDGSAALTVSGGVPPYSYNYSSGSTSSMANSLCPGFYSVRVSDMGGDTNSTSFVISNPKAIIVDTTSSSSKSLADSVIVATLPGNAVQNCSIDLSKVDSVNIASYNQFSTDSISVTWNIYIGGVADNVIDHYGIGPDGVYTLILQVYCNAGGSGQKTSGTFTGFIKATAKVYIGAQIATGISNITTGNTLVFPNPATDILTITSSENGSHFISLYDICGRLVAGIVQTNGQSIYTMHVSSLSAGCYMLKVQSATKVEFIKIVKE
jgi:hypothetical protein